MTESYSPITLKHDFKSLRKIRYIVLNVAHTRKFFKINQTIYRSPDKNLIYHQLCRGNLRFFLMLPTHKWQKIWKGHSGMGEYSTNMIDIYITRILYSMDVQYWNQICVCMQFILALKKCSYAEKKGVVNGSK